MPPEASPHSRQSAGAPDALFPPPAARRRPVEMSAAEVKDALRRRHPSAGGAWVCVDEALSGWSNYGTGGIDLLAIGVWKTAKAPGLPGCGKLQWDHTVMPARSHSDARNPLVAYEVKVSRSDFRRELYGYKPGSARGRGVPAWPGKARYVLDRVHYFLFATPRGLLWEDEIARREPWGADAPRRGALYVPDGVGLVEVDGRGCTVRVPAVLRPDPASLTRHETHEIMRRIDYRAAARGREEAANAA